MKRLNVYTPPGKIPTKSFLRRIESAVPAGVEVCRVDGETGISEVGFDLDPYAKLAIHQDLTNNVRDDSGFWNWFLKLIGIR